MVQIVRQVRSILKAWADDIRTTRGVNAIYLFGSLIYLDGARFGTTSDVDLVVMVPDEANTPVKRAAFIANLRESKISLEQKLTGALSRQTSEPVCSLIPATSREIGADLHKDGAEGFFTNNEFLDLLTDTKHEGFPGAGSTSITNRLIKQCLRFAQKKRHAYLRIAADGSGSLEPFDGEGPLPKDIMRHAAMMASLKVARPPIGSEYDVDAGLSELLGFLNREQGRGPEYKALHDWQIEHIQKRGGALTPDHELLLAEILWTYAEINFQNERAAGRVYRGPQHDSVTTFFMQIGHAFPGKRGIYWVTDPTEIEMRLTRLFEGVNFQEEPIWIFRSLSVGLTAFSKIGPETYLFDHIEVKVRRIAMYQSQRYQYCFLYVECDPLPATGIDPGIEAYAADRYAGGDCFSEEFGLTDDGHYITRTEYDDGAAEIDGQIVSTTGRQQPRVRYLTPFNFVLSAQMSPINNVDFDQRLADLMDRMLRGEDLLETLVKEVEQLPARDMN